MTDKPRTGTVCIVELWLRSSADYNAARRLAVLQVDRETTVGSILDWAGQLECFTRGSIIIEDADHV